SSSCDPPMTDSAHPPTQSEGRRQLVALDALAARGFSIGPVANTLALRVGDTMLCAPTVSELLDVWLRAEESAA
ncbi:MAG: hypothetical protein M3P26_16450, partial [Gemmatimonadota bacterium]|nr:hypothetical protein [Gemmatimonadota bacterium]